ncbi:DUF3427 domain-containing protein [Ferruginibacter yonginensis]|uniref:DUF3427 domain-containing protein n=1 Tax=Ferruginibacter yonginensis TaxID=1310416 RepID=A0ABV8QSC1_9BACT
MNQGIYEALVTQLVAQKIDALDTTTFYVNKTSIDKEEASTIISKHLTTTIKNALDLLGGDKQLELQIEVANKIIHFLKDTLKNEDFQDDLIDVNGEILKAVFNKVDAHFADFDLRLKEITPYTRLSHSELFTGGNRGISLESELKKEILSADRIDLLVSFIKFKGIIILEKELTEFTKRGGKLRVITTTYMGASDYKAIEILSKLNNTEVKISYNTGNERLHAKAYLFFRNSGFHTGYIGSSNFSRSALTDGLEWNIKVTTKEVAHIIDKFQKTFESYWQSNDFEIFNDSIHKDKLISSLSQGKNSNHSQINLNYFDIKPYSYQEEILEKLQVERSVHHRFRNLVVAATGTGKTIISAFDFKRYRNEFKHTTFLFLAHRKEILEQSLSTYRGILRDNNFGQLWVDGFVPTNYEHVFASVQTIVNRLDSISLSPEYYDYVVIDECHHIQANTYKQIIKYFKPKILLGLTATPERMDGEDILTDFDNHVAAEIRLPEALNRKLLCPFQYFGISDSIDLSKVGWQRGKYIASELSSIYTSNDKRVGEIVSALNKYTKSPKEVKALAFCISMEHAQFMASKFALLGLKADYLTSANNQNREIIKQQFLNGDINYLFVVDIFNEGVDIPEIDTVLFLRPTESLTIFLQQLGRGLRLAENKDSLTVLDFVGNARPEYNFENKFRALIGKTVTTVHKEIEDNFPHLPLGCSIILERKAKEAILQNIANATSVSRNQLIAKIRNFKNVTSLEFNLKNFITFYGVSLLQIYERGGWKRLCQIAGVIDDFSSINEVEFVKMVKNKWLSVKSSSYFKFILDLANTNFNISETSNINDVEKIMLLMLHYDFRKDAANFNNVFESISHIGNNKVIVNEMIEVLNILIDEIDFIEKDIELPFPFPLKIHSRYTRDQILVALGLSTFEVKSSIREGIAENKLLNTEVLFINLIKSEENFSPTTMYDDYAINEYLFHWQSQNTASPITSKGLSYINHVENNKRILLFIREKAKDENRKSMGYVFIGEASIADYYGAKPMNIKWELKEPIPHYLWNDTAKLRIG